MLLAITRIIKDRNAPQFGTPAKKDDLAPTKIGKDDLPDAMNHVCQTPSGEWSLNGMRGGIDIFIRHLSELEQREVISTKIVSPSTK